MAKDKSGSAAKKKKSVKLGDGVELKLKVSRGKKAGSKKAGPKKAGPKASTSKSHSAADALARLVESPLVADLIAVGATAAVAAIAAGMSSKDGAKSKSSVKTAGKAAANAIGARLMSEFSAIKKAAQDAKAK